MARDDFGSMFMRFWMARMMEGESQIQEHIEWTPRTKGLVPLAQAATMFLGLLAVVLGLGLLAWGATRVVEVDLSALDALLAGVLLGLLLLLAVVAVQSLLQGSAASVVGGFGALVGLVAVAGLVLALTRDRLDAPAAWAVATAPVLMVAGGALAWRQMLDLVDPFGKVSAMERRIAPYIPMLFEGPEQAERLVIPYRVNGELREPAAAMRADGEPIVRARREDVALVEFIREAETRGLSRRGWLRRNRANVVLPRSGMEVGRDTYDEMIGELAAWGIVARGGEGHRHHWMMRPAEAIGLIEREMVSQLVEGERV